MRLSQVLKIAAEVARGMDYLHQRKIIHRDLKVSTAPWRQRGNGCCSTGQHGVGERLFAAVAALGCDGLQHCKQTASNRHRVFRAGRQ